MILISFWELFIFAPLNIPNALHTMCGKNDFQSNKWSWVTLPQHNKLKNKAEWTKMHSVLIESDKNPCFVCYLFVNRI